MMSCYKYGAPIEMNKEEIVKLQKEFDDMSQWIDELLHDPDRMQEIHRNAKITNTIRPCDLDRQFTI